MLPYKFFFVTRRDQIVNVHNDEYGDPFAAISDARRMLISRAYCEAVEVWQTTKRVYRESRETALEPNKSVLVVEDDIILAEVQSIVLRRAGWNVVGPLFLTVDAARKAASEETFIGAIIDVNVGDDLIFSVANLIIERGLPFFFLTAANESVFPANYTKYPRLQKPAEPEQIINMLGEILWAKTWGIDSAWR